MSLADLFAPAIRIEGAGRLVAPLGEWPTQRPRTSAQNAVARIARRAQLGKPKSPNRVKPR